MTRPKIKDKLPEKLPPVEPDAKGKPDPGTGETDAKEEAPKKTTLLKYDPNIKLTDEQKEALEIEMDEERDKIEKEEQEELQEEMNEVQDDLNAKEAQPDKYPSHAGKAEQPFLFGEADQILNALETELSQWQGTWSRYADSISKLQEKMHAARDRIEILSSAVEVTRKHATMKEDPTPPTKLEPEILTPEQQGDITKGRAMDNDRLDDKETTPSSTDPAPEAPTSSAPVAKGAAERNKATEDLLVKFRNPTQPLPDLLFPGDILVTSWETGPYRVEQISGPFHAATVGDEEVPSPDHYSIQCSDVDAKRNKDGRLPKNYAYSYLNMVIAVGNRFLSVYADSQDEVVLTGEGVDKKKDISKQEPNPEPVEAKKPEEEIY